LSSIEERKEEHVRISLEGAPFSKGITTGFEEVFLVHEAISDLDFDEIKISSTFEDKEIGCPLIISSMTGGFPGAKDINRNLAKAAEALKIPMGVGSTRAGLALASSTRETYSVVREAAPSTVIISNIGAQQLREGGTQLAKEAVDLVKADALAIHLNKLQEVVMPEGEPKMKGTKEKVMDVIEQLDVPCVAKETGCGISKEVAKELKAMGFRYIDIAGAGGTNFAVIETYRAMKRGLTDKVALGDLFSDWGIPTAISLIETNSTGLKIVASGGIKNGLDGAKAIALNADYVGIARPILEQAVKGHEHVEKWILGYESQLRTAMFLTGARNLDALRKRPVILTGKIGQWAMLRGFQPSALAQRGFTTSVH